LGIARLCELYPGLTTEEKAWKNLRIAEEWQLAHENRIYRTEYT
jgi:hypothetical protein